ncbi:plasmid mobilization relaxosome protein MobC [Mucilaginibacter sp. RS28]|uniref:Plasmid mobilization relaxosome protein MobC n=1 Tax=Mucilaginibacter straminoryzae TaxID=2932774 RepID=A0A9X2B7V1_9SPHI|nr:plasmid mobilization relaxosome protein MobC [Mucilaginibacter straminoryzae]MCJ8208080.1 plasmid mobilization relaxosome protein MobC [Mucilaginibacter straminoryzae]
MKQEQRTRKLTVRFTPEEYNQISSRQKKSTTRIISDYVRDVLLEGKITLYYRNQSLDQLIDEFKLLRRELSAVGNNFNQVVKKINSVKDTTEMNFWLDMAALLQKQLLEKTGNINEKIAQISDIWLQGL